MKSPEHAAFKIILIVAVIIAVAALPLVARGDHHRAAPPTFEQFDADGDGFVSEDEFVTFRAARMKERAEAGHKMRGAAKAPPFSDIDTDGDGKLDLAEFTAGREAHQAAMREERGGPHGEGQGGRHGHARPMPTFGDLDLDGNGCIDAEEFAKHQAERHGRHGSPE
jgi:Ca2+-binding EF-hand superfamily protein